MRCSDDRGVVGSIERVADGRTFFWRHLGLSAETAYWAIFAAGLVVLVLLIMEILGSLGT